MSRSLSDDVLEATIQALSATSGDALAKAAAEGFPDRSEVVERSDRLLGLVLQQRDRSALRAELPALAERFLRILATVTLAPGIDARVIAERLFGRLPAVRARQPGQPHHSGARRSRRYPPRPPRSRSSRRTGRGGAASDRSGAGWHGPR